MGMFGGDNELGNILQEAVKLKSAQMGQKRKQYETWPFFVQHTIFHSEKEDFKAWRQLPFAEKMKVSERIKEEGNELHSKGQWSDAVDKYEEAATLFYYCYSTDPGWRKNNRGIDDDVIVLVDDQGSSPEEAEQQKRLRLQCCLNLAACKQKMEKYDEVIAACNTALELDPRSVKALYRRAEARVRPSKATAYDHDLAIKDLAKAHEVDPKNQVVEKLLGRLREERKVQREKDQGTFAGMFDRGTIYDASKLEAAEAVASGKTEGLEMQDLQQRIANISDEDSLEKRCQDAELLRDLYMRNGKEEEARELNEQIKAAKKAIKQKEQPETRPAMDWDHPTPEMIEDAKKYDLDLTDPMVIAELKRLEQEGAGDEPPEGEEDQAGEQQASSSTSQQQRQQPQHTTAFDGGLPPRPEADGPPTPWMRYFILFAAMVVGWRVLDSGFLRWGPVWLWRRGIPRLVSALNGRDDPIPQDDRGGVFARAYRGLSHLAGAEAEDEEL